MKYTGKLFKKIARGKLTIVFAKKEINEKSIC
jgi:hypothetical protein